jgi:Nitrile hydratase beta subunit
MSSSNHPHKGPHDIGGEQAGSVDTIDHGMKFWERQANALRSVLQRNKVTCTDELRRAAEDLGEQYSKLHYFEITTSALRTILLEKGLITEQELEAKMDEVRARFNVPDEMESPIKKGAKR